MAIAQKNDDSLSKKVPDDSLSSTSGTCPSNVPYGSTEATPQCNRDRETDQERDGQRVASSSGGKSFEASTLSACTDAEHGMSSKDSNSEARRSRLQTCVIVLALATALFLAALDGTITTTAIPTIVADFNSPSGYVWVGAAYALGNASFMPMWGKISDIFGRKPVLLTAVATFWTGSLLCATSVSMGMFICSRAIQGIGAGGLVVLPNICISDLFSMRNRSQYLGALGMVWAVASACGPILGGVFTQKISWRWCFYINLPICGVAFVTLSFFLQIYNPRTPAWQAILAIDWVGGLLIIAGTVMLLLGLQFGGGQIPWNSPTVICLIISGIFTIGLAVLYERKVAKYPVLPVHIYKSRNSVVCSVIAFLHAFVFMSANYWLPLYFQGVLGLPTLISGLCLLPFGVSLSVCSAVVGYFIKRTGKFKVFSVAGMALMVIGFGLFIDLGARRNWAKVIVFEVIAGVAVGPNFQSPLIGLQNDVQPHDIASATSSLSFLRELGTSVAFTVGGVIFNNRMQAQQYALQGELPPEVANLLAGSNAAGSVTVVGQMKGQAGDVARQAFWNSMQTMFIVFTGCAAVGFVVSLFLRQTILKTQHSEHKTGLNTLQRNTL